MHRKIILQSALREFDNSYTIRDISIEYTGPVKKVLSLIYVEFERLYVFVKML